MPTRKRRVFISFDFDNDKVLREFVVEQAKLPDSPFGMADWSMKEAAPQRNWEMEAWKRITRSDSVMVILGPLTYRAPGVLKEVRMARELKRHIFQMIGYRNADPKRIPNAGITYRWNWENLKKLLAPVPIGFADNTFRPSNPFRTSRRRL